MSYIGNPIISQAFLTDQFSGTGSTTAFILTVAPANSASILVAVSGVLQDPSTYGVAGTTLTFSAAPPSGTANISVRYLGIPSTGVTSTAYRTITEVTATASQTTFTPASYTVGFLNVYQNGVLLGSADYTASNGTSVVLSTGATVGDLLLFESFNVSSVLNAIPATTGAVSPSYLAAAGASKAFLDVVNSDGTGGVILPSGTTAQRPSSPTPGTIRRNTTLGLVEAYDNGTWQNLTSSTYSASYLVVAGGGAGGQYVAGGGGAGGLLTGTATLSAGSAYTVTVGAGAAVNSTYGSAGTNGSSSLFYGTGISTVTTVGGGGGGSNGGQATSGGSGGGGADPDTYPTAGSGTSGQGYAGGNGCASGNNDNYQSGGGGGGAGAVGAVGVNNGSGGAGGIGVSSSITGTATYYAGGGGGCTGSSSAGTFGAGGSGGGGSGGPKGGGANGVSGTANTGGGGGGGPTIFPSGTNYGGGGGSGVVIVSYIAAAQRGSGGTVTSYTSGPNTYWVHTFTSSGTFTA